MPGPLQADPSSSSSVVWDVSRNVAESMTRSSMRAVLLAIAEQNEDWIEPMVEIWGRHMASMEDTATMVSWLRSELDLWKRNELHEDDNMSSSPEEEKEAEEEKVDLDASTLDDVHESTSVPKCPFTAWAKLRRLGNPNDRVLDVIGMDEPSSYEEHLQQAIDQLDHYGRTNQTYWLHDQWPVIQRAVDQMRARLHPPPKNATATIPSPQAWDAQLSKALLSSTVDDETMRQLVDRKRKSVGKKRQWNPALQQFVPKQKRRRTVEEIDAPPDGDVLLVPRPASEFQGSAQLDWKRAVEEVDWTVDDCIHAAASSTTTSAIPSSRLLGALRDLGHWHGFHQSRVDTASTSIVRPRDALRARLGNHRPEEVKKQQQRPWSRVLRTLSSESQHWFDLDVGLCVLEHADDGALYAFRSLEICLRDEDS